MTQSRTGSSNSCDCYSYYGASENFNDHGTCRHCSSCTNDSCKCLSEDECATTWTIVGIVVGILIIIALAVYCQQKRRRRLRQERLGFMTDNQPQVYDQPVATAPVQPAAAGYNDGNMYGGTVTTTATTQQPVVVMQTVQQQPQPSNPTDFNPDIDDQPPLYDEVEKR